MTAAAVYTPAGAAASTAIRPAIIRSEYGPSAGPLLLADGSHRWEPGFGVQRNPVVRLVFWGARWQNDTTGVVAGVEALFRELPGSAWGGVLEQYGVHNDTRLAGTVIDPSPPPGRRPLTLRDVARETDHARALMHSSADGQWVLLPQTGTNLAKLQGECGEHDQLLTDTGDGDAGVIVDGDEGSGANLRNKPGWVVAGGWLVGPRLPRLGMMVARAAGPSRSGLRPALRAPLTRLP